LTLAYLLLAVAQILGLILIPFGLPGTWLQVAALIGFAWWTGFATVGIVPIVVVLLLALLAEIGELLLAGTVRPDLRRRPSRGVGRHPRRDRGRHGRCSRFPLLGSVFGAMIGAFVGAALFELFGGSALLAPPRAPAGARSSADLSRRR
jgi:hypothetical protein